MRRLRRDVAVLAITLGLLWGGMPPGGLPWSGAARGGLAQAQSADQRFQLTLPLTLDGAYLGGIAAEIDLDERAAVAGGRLLELLGPRLDAKTREALRAAVGDQPVVGLETVRAAGVMLVYDPADIALRVELPAEQRAVTDLSLGAVSAERPEDATPPARQAAGLSLAAGQDFVHQSDGEDDGMGEVVAVATDFVTIGGFDGVSLVFEGAYDGTDEDQRSGSAAMPRC